MDFVSVKEYAAVHGLAERTIRNYCVQGKIRGAKLIGKTWSIPTDAALPQRKKTSNGVSPLLEALRREKEAKIKGGIYHRTQIDFTYNSNHIEGNRLTRVDDAASAAAYNDGFEFKDAVKQANEYAYDANGNLTKDLNKNISNIQYNFLNLKKIGCTSTKVNRSKLLLPFVFGLHYLCPARSPSVTAVPSPTHTPPTARSCARCISQAVRPPLRTIAAT